MRYDQSIDRIRGFLVPLMVFAHVLQFFGDMTAYPAAETILNIINILVFPTFVFCFGRSAAVAYLHKPFKKAAPRLIKTILTLYSVFALSGIGYRILADGKPFGLSVVEKVLFLKDIPGWSEFLAAFAAFALAVLALYAPLKWLSRHFTFTLAAMAACLACCFLPYGAIKSNPLGLFIGTTRFSCFPVIQYAPYLLAGIYWQENHMHGRIFAAIGLAATLTGILYTIRSGLPERFPPTVFWVLLAGFFPVITSYLAAVPISLPKIPGMADRWLRNVGRRSLFYLLSSNLVIFTLKGLDAAPLATKRNNWFWQQPIASPLGAMLWTAALILTLGIAASLAGRTSEKQQREPEKVSVS
jgi:hypothetical protein